MAIKAGKKRRFMLDENFLHRMMYSTFFFSSGGRSTWWFVTEEFKKILQVSILFSNVLQLYNSP